MKHSEDAPSVPPLGYEEFGYEEWRALLRAMSGRRFNAEGIERNAFVGWVRPVSVYGLTALNIGCNAERVERTYRDVRLDGVDDYFAVLQVGGKSAVTHNDQSVQLTVGDAVLVDAARPVTYFANDESKPLNVVALKLPRDSLVSYLGFDPQGGICRRSGTIAGRLLFELIRCSDRDEGSASSPADSYLQLVVYDLVGALFAPSNPSPLSRHSDMLFARIRNIINDRFTDPDFDSCQLANEAGLSLRYVQKLFTERGATFSQFVYSLRLDHAARLLQRKASLRTRQPLSEIAYGCGFRDYAHFARRFRHRFGCAPGAHLAGQNGKGDGAVRGITT